MSPAQEHHKDSAANYSKCGDKSFLIETITADILYRFVGLCIYTCLKVAVGPAIFSSFLWAYEENNPH